MKATTIRMALGLSAGLFGASLTAQVYQRCENFEYAELKSMSAKQLQVEYCNSLGRSEEMTQIVATSSINDPKFAQAKRDRDDCSDSMAKMRRQDQFKKVKTECPDVKRVNPLEAAIEQSKAETEQLKRQINRMK